MYINIDRNETSVRLDNDYGVKTANIVQLIYGKDYCVQNADNAYIRNGKDSLAKTANIVFLKCGNEQCP